MTLCHLNRYEEALENSDRAIQIQPDDAPAWHNRGVTLYHLNRYEESLESFDRTVQIQPDDAPAWHNRGMVLGRLDRHNEALESYDRAIQNKPDDAPTWYNRGLVLLRHLGRYKESLESFDKAVQIQPDYANTWIKRGVALYYMDRYNGALESAKKAMELAEAQGMDDILISASLLAAVIRMLASLKSIEEDNLGSARRALEGAIEDGKEAEEGSFRSALFGYLKDMIRSGKTEFAREAIGIIVSELGEDYDRLLRPFSVAIEYMETGDESILERLQQEERELVLEIAEQTEAQQEEN